MSNLLQKLFATAARVLLGELKGPSTDATLEEEIRRALGSLESVLMISATNCPFISALSHLLHVSETDSSYPLSRRRIRRL